MLFENSLNILLNAIKITGFVFVMMLVIEYINVQTSGLWQDGLSKSRWKQYLLAAFLGAIPGCLGAFTVVTLFSHRLISFGAIVTAMIATSGDEAFVMFAMFPKQAAVLTVLLIIIGILAGFITDKFHIPQKFLNKLQDNKLPLHTEPQCKCFQKDKFIQQLIKPSFHRFILIIAIIFLIVAVSTGLIAGHAKLWVKSTILITGTFSLFVVISVPDHFLNEHIWKHIVKVHLPKIFLWTFGTLLVLSILLQYIDIENWIGENILLILVLAVLVGLIPESGPHLIFVTLFVQGSIPFSILLASSVSQDGHGMLPMLAESKRGFLAVKAVNIVFALITGFVGYLMGF